MAKKEDMAQLNKVAGEHTVLGERRGLTKKMRILKDAAQNGDRWTLRDTWHKGEGSALKRKRVTKQRGALHQ
jgi:hypothetical protein